MSEGQAVYTFIEGKSSPLGAHCRDGGVNFSVFSSEATKINLLLFRTCNDVEPFQTIELNKKNNCEFGFWHIFVENMNPEIYYAYRVFGPQDISQGYRYNPNKILIDPYAKGISDSLWNREAACNQDDNLATSMRGCVLDVSGYDWEGIEKPNIPFKETIIYEMHVKGFTNSPTSGVKNAGTYSAITEKIPHLKQLGINAIELMPIMQFDENEPNYWGYNTIGFFAMHNAYCISPDSSNMLNEFRDMVKELHRNNIEVILDVVYNHTGEGNQDGPVINFKGFDNNLYYSLAQDKRYYRNYSACGNSLSCNHPIVQKLIFESLEFWATQMQVDGFRFDLGTILTLDTHGEVLEYPPVLWEIELRETLSDCKLIAEPWGGDGSGQLYQLGNIHGYRWSQWNGQYRDCIRRFVRGDEGIIGEVATRISGNADLYQGSGHFPTNSVNFITCHDGLTLNDLVSYTNDWQLSWNCGEQGESENPDIQNLRLRQIKNFVAILFLSKGVPMILSGDEMRRTQNGSDNGYQLDNEQGWLNWDLVSQNDETFQKMINLRKQTYFLQTRHFYTGTIPDGHTRGLNDINWHGTLLNQPKWDDPSSRVLAFTIAGIDCKSISNTENHSHKDRFKDEDVHVMMNMCCESLTFEIPQIEGRCWYIYIDTFENQSTEDILYSQNSYNVRPKSIVILVSK